MERGEAGFGKAQGALRSSQESPGSPQRGSKMELLSRRKIGKFLAIFPAILWMRGLSDYLSRLPEELPVSLVALFWATLVH